MRYQILCISVLLVIQVSGQATLNIQQCEDLFQKNNLHLLAETFNIDIAKANVIQSKIWDLPVISTETNLYNSENKRILNLGKIGQFSGGIDQLLYLGGKKKKEVEWAKTNVRIAEIQFEQLLSTLRFELHKNFYEIYFYQQEQGIMSNQLLQVNTLITAYETQAQLGNVPLKDVVRLKSLALSFKNELSETTKNILDCQEKLSILLGINDIITPSVAHQDIEEKLTRPIIFNATELISKAKTQNPDYLLQLQLHESSQLMYQWQQSMSIPDLTIGLGYDRRGGFFDNEINIRAGIPIPLWNINKGNIQHAKHQIDMDQTTVELKLNEISQSIIATLEYFNFLQNQFAQNNQTIQDFESVYTGIVDNFQKKNISMIEFTDFIESYNQSFLFLNHQKKEILVNGLTLNYLVNDKIF